MKFSLGYQTRRDKCYLVGRRGQRLTGAAAIYAWQNLSARLIAMQERDVPKFNDILIAIRVATIQARRKK